MTAHTQKKKTEFPLPAEGPEDADMIFVVRVILIGPPCLRTRPSAPSAYKRHIHASLNDIQKVRRALGEYGGRKSSRQTLDFKGFKQQCEVDYLEQQSRMKAALLPRLDYARYARSSPSEGGAPSQQHEWDTRKGN